MRITTHTSYLKVVQSLITVVIKVLLESWLVDKAGASPCMYHSDLGQIYSTLRIIDWLSTSVKWNNQSTLSLSLYNIYIVCNFYWRYYMFVEFTQIALIPVPCIDTINNN